MELYEIKNGLDKAHLLIDEYRKSAQIDEKLREIEGLSANGSDLYVQFAQRAELTQGRF